MIQLKKKVVKKTTKQIQIDKVKSQRARFFLTHAKMASSLAKYKSAKNFLANFKPSFFRTRRATFMVDLVRGLYPTPVSVALKFNPTLKGNAAEHIYEARIRFKDKKVIVESVQGSAFIEQIRDFENSVGLTASRFLLREIITNAKKNKYNQVLLRRPKTHPSYKNPSIEFALSKRGRELRDKILFEESTPTERKEFEQIKIETTSRIRANMIKVYENMALGEGFKRKKDYYIKEL